MSWMLERFEQGTHESLLAQRGVYYNLVLKQLSSKDAEKFGEEDAKTVADITKSGCLTDEESGLSGLPGMLTLIKRLSSNEGSDKISTTSPA